MRASEEVLRQARAKPLPSLPPLQRRVLEYLEAHPSEVFSYQDTHELAGKIGQTSGEEVRWSLWVLDGNGLLAKATLGRKIYFGSRLAIDRLLLASRAATL